MAHPYGRNALEDALDFDAASKLLRYDAESGILTRLTEVRTGRGRIIARPGDMAGGLDKYGYVTISIDGRRYKAHRVAWLLTYGEWPDGFLDHANGVKNDNRLANLRIATVQQNNANRGLLRNNTSGHKGVVFHKPSGLWAGHVWHDNCLTCVGYFKTKDDAAMAVAKKHSAIFKEFSRLA